MYPRSPFALTSALTCCTAAVAALGIPFCTSLTLLVLCLLVMGVMIGLFETSVVAFLSTLWGKASLPFRQLLILFTGAGAAVSPLLLSPFLAKINHTTSESAPQEEPVTSAAADVNLITPYAVMASVTLGTAACFLAQHFLSPETRDHPSRRAPVVGDASQRSYGSTEAAKGQEEPDAPTTATARVSLAWRLLLLALAASIILVEGGFESAMRSFLPTFAISKREPHLALPQATAASMVTAYAAASSGSRIAGMLLIGSLVSIEFAFGFSAAFLLLGSAVSLVIPVVSQTLREPLLWTTATVIAVGSANIPSCLFSFLDQYIRLTSGVASAIRFAGGVAFVLFSTLLSLTVPSVPMSLFWCLAACSVVSVARRPASLAKRRSPRDPDDREETGERLSSLTGSPSSRPCAATHLATIRGYLSVATSLKNSAS